MYIVNSMPETLERQLECKLPLVYGYIACASLLFLFQHYDAEANENCARDGPYSVGLESHGLRFGSRFRLQSVGSKTSTSMRPFSGSCRGRIKGRDALRAIQGCFVGDLQTPSSVKDVNLDIP